MYKQYSSGWIEVICGCMFAGKSEELIRRINTLEYAKKNIIVFKPLIDDRYSEDEIASHKGNKIKCYSISRSKDILKFIEDDTDVVAIDEVQFFDENIIPICEMLADKQIRVIVAGLDKDFKGKPFHIMSELLARAEFVTKLSAICVKCGAPATITQRLVNNKPASYKDPIILIGASESYEARCRHCHIVEDKPKIKL